MTAKSNSYRIERLARLIAFNFDGTAMPKDEQMGRLSLEDSIELLSSTVEASLKPSAAAEAIYIGSGVTYSQVGITAAFTASRGRAPVNGDICWLVTSDDRYYLMIRYAVWWELEFTSSPM